MGDEGRVAAGRGNGGGGAEGQAWDTGLVAAEPPPQSGVARMPHKDIQVIPSHPKSLSVLHHFNGGLCVPSVLAAMM